MQSWCSAYLAEWCKDFEGESDFDEAVKLHQRLLDSLQAFSDGQSSIEDTAASMLMPVEGLEERDDLLGYIIAILFEAAESSPMSVEAVARLTQALLRCLRDDAECLEAFNVNLIRRARQGFNGPDMRMVRSKEQETALIESWWRLNTFAAQLTRLDACSMADDMLLTFNRTFCYGSANTYVTDRELDYLLPAAAMWIDIIGKEVYGWSTAGAQTPDHDIDALFTVEKWSLWREGFLKHSEDAGRNDMSRRNAAEALHRMKEIERE